MLYVQRYLRIAKKHFINCTQRADFRHYHFTSHSSKWYQSGVIMEPWHRQSTMDSLHDVFSLRLLFPWSSKEFSVRSVEGCARMLLGNRLILCAHSACRQSAGHKSSSASNNTTTNIVASLSGLAVLALAHEELDNRSSQRIKVSIKLLNWSSFVQTFSIIWFDNLQNKFCVCSRCIVQKQTLIMILLHTYCACQ